MGESTMALRDAATVILVHGRGAAGCELFMVKRHAKVAFMASAYVYPGGRLDAADSDPALAPWLSGLDGAGCRARLGEAALEEGRARGLFVAALREAFEEAGVLLAHRRGDPARAPIGLDDAPDLAARLGAWRRRLCAGAVGVGAMLEAEGLVLMLDALWPMARWITPPIEPRRYDARFFVARCPTAQRDHLVHDAGETVDSAWLTPAEALAGYEAQRLQLAPPTLHTLETLAARDAAGGLAAVLALARARARRGVAPVAPVGVADEAGGLTLLLPGDPAYPDQRAAPIEGPTRMILRDGRWSTQDG